MRPDAEIRRLAELHAMQLVGASIEEHLLAIVAYVATTFGTSTAAVTLIDRDVAWCKAAVGDVPAETPREDAICDIALATDGALVIADAGADHLTRNLPGVGVPNGVRFYAGVALRGPGGQPVGTLAITDPSPRSLTEAEEASLVALGKIVERHLRMLSELERTRRKQRAAELFDPTTGLPTREHQRTLVERAILGDADVAAVLGLLVEVRGLRELSAVRGECVFNRAVREVAERFRSTVDARTTLARTESARFFLVAPSDGTLDPLQMVDALVQSVAHPLLEGHDSVQVNLVIGASVLERDNFSPNLLLDRASTALAEATRDAARPFRVADPATTKAVARRFDIRRRLPIAIAEGCFRLVYQPKVDAATQELLGMEALLRWKDAELGEVSPLEFIPVAEASGLMLPLGAWVLREACRQIKRWQSDAPRPLQVAVNIAASQLLSPGFFELVDDVMQEEGIEGSWLNLEVTESALLEDVNRAISVMHELCALGVTFAIDDFGTGYSSLGYLRNLPVDVLKVDRAFVRELRNDSDDAAIVQAIVQLGRTLKMRVVAEGVETPEQVELLRRFRCDELQGYYFGRPEAPEVFERNWLLEVTAAE